jgi:hypothetical protein
VCPKTCGTVLGQSVSIGVQEKLNSVLNALGCANVAIRDAERKTDHEGHFPDLEQVSLIAIRTLSATNQILRWPRLLNVNLSLTNSSQGERNTVALIRRF